MAALREWSVTGKVMVAQRLRRVDQFLAAVAVGLGLNGMLSVVTVLLSPRRRVSVLAVDPLSRADSFRNSR